MQIIDQSTWPRKEAFDFYSAISCPFYMVTFRLDVTRLCQYVKAPGAVLLSIVDLSMYGNSQRDRSLPLCDPRWAGGSA